MSRPFVYGSESLNPETLPLLLVAVMQEFASWYLFQAQRENDNLEITFVEFTSAGEPFVPDIVGVQIGCSFVDKLGYSRRVFLTSTCSISRRRDEPLRFVFAPLHTPPAVI